MAILGHARIREEMKELLLQRMTSRKGRVACTDEFVLKGGNPTLKKTIL